MVLVGILIFGLVITAALYICKFVLFLTTSAVMLSRAVFSVAVAALLHFSYSLVDNGWANFGIWAGICLAACYILCLMPRFSCAFQFFCTSVVSYIAVEIVVALFGSIVMLIMGKEYQPNLWLEIAVKVVCGGCSAWALREQIEKSPEGTDNPILANAERLLASLLYAVSITFLSATAVNNLWSFPPFVNWLIFFGALVVAFLVDMFVFDRMRGHVYHRPVSFDGGSSGFEVDSNADKTIFGMDEDSYNNMMDDAWDDRDSKEYDGFGNHLPQDQIDDN